LPRYAKSNVSAEKERGNKPRLKKEGCQNTPVANGHQYCNKYATPAHKDGGRGAVFDAHGLKNKNFIQKRKRQRIKKKEERGKDRLILELSLA